MAEQMIQVEAETLEEARAILKVRIPEGFRLLSEQVISNGKPTTLKATAETTMAAFDKARSELPPDATILQEVELRAPERRTIVLEAFDEQAARAAVRNKTTYEEEVANLKLVAPGKKRLFGLMTDPSKYEAEVVRNARVEIKYVSKAKISAKVGEKPKYDDSNAVKYLDEGVFCSFYLPYRWDYLENTFDPWKPETRHFQSSEGLLFFAPNGIKADLVNPLNRGRTFTTVQKV